MAEEALGAFFNELLGRCVSIECTHVYAGPARHCSCHICRCRWHRTEALSAVFVNDNEGVPMIQGESPSCAACTARGSTAQSSTGAEAGSVLAQSCSQTPG
eukprot:COSAG02_NODE_1335_length_13197_cov_5.830279_9_plen_101_part_00